MTSWLFICVVLGPPAAGLILGYLHRGELAVFEQLCAVVDEAIDLYRRDGKPLPPPTSGRDYATKLLNVA